MPVTFVEDNESRSATILRKGLRGESTYAKSWKAFGTSNDQELHREIYSQIPDFWQYPDQPGAVFYVDSYTVTYLGDKAWQVTASYKKTGIEDDTKREPLKRSRSFETGGATTHITQAISETAFGGGPNQFKAIGVDGNNVAGVDVVTPQLNWTEDYEVPSNYVTSGYINTLFQLTGTVNNAAFRGFAAGEVLFIGASGGHEWDEERGDGPWKLSYKFVASPNAGAGSSTPAITVGDITGITKKGHEYMWVRYEDSVSDSTLLKKPRHVYVNRVYREASFASLGIGVS